MTHDELEALFEYRDGDLYWKVTNRGRGDISKPAGSIHHTGYRNIGIGGMGYLAHRLIYLMHNPEWDITDTSQCNSVDHRDEDKLNNNIGNLRIATSNQQKHNTGMRKNNTSGHKGVSWCKRAGKWEARVKKNNKQFFGGTFVNLEDAIAKATQMRNELHGEFVKHK